jgi:hypothetical protein
MHKLFIYLSIYSSIYFLFIYLLWYWGLNAGSHACWDTSATLPDLFLLEILETESLKLFSWAGLCLLRSYDYRPEPQALAAALVTGEN